MIPIDKYYTPDKPIHDSEANGDTEGDVCFTPYPSNGICARFGDKWTVQILWHLSIAREHRLRFSALKGEIGGITQRMLTLSLRNLERDGLVIRHYFPEVPPRVEYELTAVGAGVLPALEGINTWVWENISHIEESRRAYDDADR